MDRKAALRVATILEAKARKIEGDLVALRTHLAALLQERVTLFDTSTDSVDLHGLHVRMQSARLRRIGQDIATAQAAIAEVSRQLELARKRCDAVVERSLTASLREAECERTTDVVEWVALRLGRVNASFPKG